MDGWMQQQQQHTNILGIFRWRAIIAHCPLWEPGAVHFRVLSYPPAGAATNNVAQECSNLILQSLSLVLDHLCSDAGTLFPRPAREWLMFHCGNCWIKFNFTCVSLWKVWERWLSCYLQVCTVCDVRGGGWQKYIFQGSNIVWSSSFFCA